MPQIVLNDIECLRARELCTLLGYTQWRNFTKVIDKAKDACANVGQQVDDHFVDVNKMVTIGSGAERQVNDIMLTRYACVPENLPAAEDIKKVGRRLASEEKELLENKKKNI